MARRAVAFSVFVAALTLAASLPTYAELTIGEAFQQIATAARKQPTVVRLDEFSDRFLIPAAGAVRGGNGTFFRSDLSIYNFRDRDQEILIGWLAQGVDNTSRQMIRLTLKDNTWYELPNVVEGTLRESGLGAIVVFAVSGQYYDEYAQLTAFSRIWTNQPGGTGTVSQSFPPVDLTDNYSSVSSYALGLVHDAEYRTNVGIVNLDDVEQSVQINLVGERKSSSMTITIPPYSMQQQPVPAGDYGRIIMHIPADPAARMWFSAYASTVDNRTGDGWVSHFMQPDPD